MINDGRKLDIGQALNANGMEFEVITVSAQEDNQGNLNNFRYELALKSEMDDWRAKQPKIDPATGRPIEIVEPVEAPKSIEVPVESINEDLQGVA